MELEVAQKDMRGIEINGRTYRQQDHVIEARPEDAEGILRAGVPGVSPRRRIWTVGIDLRAARAKPEGGEQQHEVQG